MNPVVPVAIIRPGGKALTPSLAEVWQSRELLYFLVWRDVKVRYKQTALGVAWSVVQPLMTMVVFTVFFGHLAKLSSDGVPYPVFSLAALIPWTYVASATSSGAFSLVGNQHLIAKVYFPRMLVPLAAVLMPGLDMAIAFVMLGLVMTWYHVVPTVGVALLPLYLMLAFLTALAVSLWTAALSVRYRDVRYVLPFATQLWLFITPVAYSASLVPDRWRLLYALNPMTTVVDGFRSALLGTPAPGAFAAVSVVTVIAVLLGGVWYFRSVEGTIVDLA
jgi:lipopolysaccharide transport system permease protein